MVLIFSLPVLGIINFGAIYVIVLPKDRYRYELFYYERISLDMFVLGINCSVLGNNFPKYEGS